MSKEINVDKIAENVAKDFLDIETLKVRNSDGLDFHEIGVASLKAALIEMYNLGKQSKD